MLKQRVITAVVAALLFLASLFLLDPDWLSVVFGVVVGLASREWARLAGLSSRIAVLCFVGSLVVLLLAGFWFFVWTLASSAPQWRQLFVAAGTFWALALLWVLAYPSSRVIWGSSYVRALMGVMVLMPAWLALSWLRQLPDGEWLVLYVILLVCVNDIAAYFAGRAWGRNKLLVNVSPGKTWAGFIGGLAGTMVCAGLVGWYVEIGAARLPGWLLISASAALAGVLGDLLESMVKRESGVKDSGTLLPGHGGILDRIDSITAAAPVFALGLIAAGFAS